MLSTSFGNNIASTCQSHCDKQVLTTTAGVPATLVHCNPDKNVPKQLSGFTAPETTAQVPTVSPTGVVLAVFIWMLVTQDVLNWNVFPLPVSAKKIAGRKIGINGQRSRTGTGYAYRSKGPLPQHPICDIVDGARVRMAYGKNAQTAGEKWAAATIGTLKNRDVMVRLLTMEFG